MFSKALTDLASKVISTARSHNLKLATAESCTGGLIAGCLTAVSGSSDVVEQGFVTYANEAKAELLGVPMADIMEHGAVSETVARKMAEGAIDSERVDIAVSVTGIAGPSGGTAEKPVGLVHIAVAKKGSDTLHERHVFHGDRDAVRLQTVEAALELLLKPIKS